MKQINDCFDRFFADKPQRKTKWQVCQPNKGDYIVLFHYDHMILMADPDTFDITYTWYECPTDKRGLDAAIEYLNNKKIEKIAQDKSGENDFMENRGVEIRRRT